MKNKYLATETISSIKWYFEAKNLAISNAMALRCPLSAEQQKEMRLYYSAYFAHLLSATEFLLDQNYPYRDDFKKALYSAFVFRDRPSGKENYVYVRELRNSVIHRGYDIAASMHFVQQFPMILAPENVTNQFGTKTYRGLGRYLLEVIAKCEDVIGSIIAKHLEAVGLLKPVMTQEESVTGLKDAISAATAMPYWAKQLAAGAVEQIDHLEVQRVQIEQTVALLNTSAVGAAIAKLVAQVHSSLPATDFCADQDH